MKDIREKINFLLCATFKIDTMSNTITEGNRWNGRSVMLEFLFPLTLLIAIETFITYIIYIDDVAYEEAFLRPIFYIVNSFIVYILYSQFAEMYCKRSNIHSEHLSLLLFMLYFTTMVIDALLVLLPSMFFISFANIYLIYQSWHIANTFFDVDETTKVRFTFIVPAILILVSVVVGKIVQLLVPNVAI